MSRKERSCSTSTSLKRTSLSGSTNSLELDDIDMIVGKIQDTDILNSDQVAIGIDLGTKNCCVAVYENTSVTIIPNSLRKKTTPSYVLLQKSGQVAVGRAVKRNAYQEPAFTIFDSKRMIGRLVTDEEVLEAKKWWQFQVVTSSNGNLEIVGRNGRNYSPEEISSLLLKDCLNLAENYLQKKISSAVITVPAYFNDNQKKATINAGELAGLKVLRLLNEPTAAAIAYRVKKIYDDSKKVLIFDLGGGTFDVAVVDISEKKINVIAIGGNTFLGGEDFDRKLVEFCLKKFKEQYNKDIKDTSTNSQVARSLTHLREECENQKIDLDALDSVKINVGNFLDGLNLEVEITRRQYEHLTDPLIDKMIEIVQDTLNSGQIEKSEINDIILVGASTKAPRLQEKLRKFFNGKNLNCQIDPDEAVAYGAAVYAAYLNNPNEVESDFDLRAIQDVVPMSIGIKATIGKDRNQFSRIIQKNTVYPYETRAMYSTHEDNQEKVRISIYQGEHDIAAENTHLGDFELCGIPKAKAGEQRIAVSMKLDGNGILRVTAECKATGTSTSLEVKNVLDTST